jgi:hypothetical protein
MTDLFRLYCGCSKAVVRVYQRHRHLEVRMKREKSGAEGQFIIAERVPRCALAQSGSRLAARGGGSRRSICYASPPPRA